MAKSNNQVAKKDEKSNLPAENKYAQYAGLGFQNQTQDDFAIPFLNLLQSNSPLDEIGNGAKGGMFINTVTNELFDGAKGLRIIPVLTKQQYVEWVPRTAGGGVAAVYEIADPVVAKARAATRFGKHVMDNKNELVQTFYVWALVVTPDGRAVPMMIAFSSTKIKAYHALTGLSSQNFIKDEKGNIVRDPKTGQPVLYPIFAQAYRLTSHKTSNKHGEFYVPSVEWDGKDAEESRLDDEDPIFKQALAFHYAAVGNKVKVDLSAERKTSGSGEATTEEDDVPFDQKIT